MTAVRYEGAETARPAPGVLEAIAGAEVVFLAPSNPFVSIGPILAVPGIVEALAAKRVVAVSPLVGGKALRGPLAEMMASLGYEPRRPRASPRSTRASPPTSSSTRPTPGSFPGARRAHRYGCPRVESGGGQSGVGGDPVIGIVGGSGDFGQGLAERLRRIGEEVVIGSRHAPRRVRLQRGGLPPLEVVFLSVPPGGVADMAHELRDDLAGPHRRQRRGADRLPRRTGGSAPGELSLAEITAQPPRMPASSPASTP